MAGKDNSFGLQSNSGVSQAEAVATIDRVANEVPPLNAGQGAQDNGVAQADGKPVDPKGLRKEFDLNDPAGAADKAEPEKHIEVETDPDAVEDDEVVVPDDKKAEADADAGNDVEPVSEWLKDVDTPTRQDILQEFMTSNIDDLTVSVRQSGKDVDLTLAELKRAAAGYSGEQAAGRQVKQLKADIDRREKALVEREQFIAKQFDDPGDLLQFLDGNVEDPVQYFTAVKDHAEAILAEAEDNPARFRRDTALRRENSQLRSDVADIKALLKGQANPGTPEKDEAASADAARRQELVDEGHRRRQHVTDLGYEVDAVAKAWTDAGEPDAFDHWFTKWAVTQERDTSRAKTDTTKKNRQRGGASLRRRGSANPKPATPAADDEPFDAKSIDKFLRNHPSNAGRMTT